LDEGAFSEATREMLASGNWVSTFLNGEPRHDKPILIYWFQALSVKIFGLHAFSFRLPSIIASFLGLYYSYRFIRDIADEKTARIFVWIAATYCLSAVIFKSAIADALLHLWMCLTFYEIFRLHKHPTNSRLFKLGLLMGLGFLTKGPVALVIPVASSLIAFALNGNIKTWAWAVFHPLSWVTLISVIAPWHIAVYLDQGVEFFKGFYLGHNLDRFSETREGHGGSIFYYLFLVPLSLLPFIGSSLGLFTRADRTKRDFVQVFLISWFAVAFLIFSFSSTQLPHYILYGMTPVMILLAMRLRTLIPDNNDENPDSKPLILANRVGGLLLTLFAALCPLLVSFVTPTQVSQYDFDVASAGLEIYRNHYFVFAIIVVVIGIAAFFAPSRYLGMHSELSRTLIFPALIMIAMNFILLPVVAEARQQPIKLAAEFSKSIEGPLIAWRINMPSFSVYSERIVKRSSPTNGDTVLTRTTYLPKLQEQFGEQLVSVLFEEKGILIIKIGEGDT
jgi:4-amino-4-deoxy-L-arabinose transferase-like glycosyltransferase